MSLAAILTTAAVILVLLIVALCWAACWAMNTMDEGE